MPTRRALLHTGLAGGALLLAPAAARGASTPDSDLAYLRLLVGVELLAGDFYDRALASGKLDAETRRLVTRIRGDERAHYTGLANLLTSLGGTPATARDVHLSYPAGAFASQSAAPKLAPRIQELAGC